jgi:predicted phosphoribosyltransferase
MQVLALPRGGVPVARPIADRLGLPLRVLLVRKIGLPGHRELAMGAVAVIGDQYFSVRNADVLRSYRVDEATWQEVLADEQDELERRATRFAGWTAGEPAGAPVILVDDGLATGATMRAAVRSVRAAGAGPVIAAIPVASGHAITALEEDGVLVCCLTVPARLIAVGESYRDFHQLSDEEVVRVLTTHERPGSGPDPGR